MKHEESDRDLGSGLKLIMGFFDFLKNKKKVYGSILTIRNYEKN